MRRLEILILPALMGFAACLAPAAEPPLEFRRLGEQALELTRQLVAIGPRPTDSEGMRRQQKLILDELGKLGCAVEQRDFTAQTPLGPRSMKNIIARFDGESDRVAVVSGHYDTYARSGLQFVGANDGGSSTGFLLALARRLDQIELKDDVWLVFFDGEESLVAWRDEDHTYGSRRLAEQWAEKRWQTRIHALINVDMIGDRGLALVHEQSSTPWLRDLIWKRGRELGYQAEFPLRSGAVADDHIPFLERGFAAVDLIDFDYGLFNRFWHTEGDTLDKLSARSFAVVLHVVSESLEELEKRP